MSDKTTLTLHCTHCKIKILTSITGEMKPFYKIPCPKCKKTFTYKTEFKNIQCYKCKEKSQYLYDEREQYNCYKCGAIHTGFVTQNKDSILTEIQKIFASYPERFEPIKNTGVAFFTSFLSVSSELNEVNLKSCLSEFQKGLYYLSEHLKLELEKENAEGKEHTE